MKQAQIQSPFVALDLLRAWAAITVFLGHVRGSSFVEFGALPVSDQRFSYFAKVFFGLTRLGHEAVMVFFVLSGFLVGGQIIRHLQEDRFRLGTYVIDRSTRIFLPLIPAVILTVVINWFVLGLRPNWFQAASSAMALNGIFADTLPGNAPLWTQSYEIWFYILGGAIAVLVCQKRLQPVAFLVVLCALFAFSILSAHYLMFWGVGAFSLLLVDHKRRHSFALVGIGFAVAGCVCYELASQSKSFASIVLLPVQVSEALICGGISLAIPYCCDSMTNRALRLFRKPAAYLSGLSYSLYLFHYPLNTALDSVFPKATELSPSSIGLFMLRAAVLWLLVSFFYRAFESNTASLRQYSKKRWLSGAGPKSATVLAGAQ
jgi:peptidoglycan/LPS O-acetylase OafA/YrhL